MKFIDAPVSHLSMLMYVCVCVCVVSCTLFIDINMHTNFVLLLQQQQLSGCLDLYAVGHLLQCTLTIIPQICY